MKGRIPEDVFESLLETLPIEFSILDENDKVLAWNKHDTRIFKRPDSVVGRDVRDCHPEKSLEKVEKIIHEMKDGKRDAAEFYIDLPINNEKHN